MSTVHHNSTPKGIDRKEVINLRRQNLSLSKISRVLGITTSTVRYHLKRAEAPVVADQPTQSKGFILTLDGVHIILDKKPKSIEQIGEMLIIG